MTIAGKRILVTGGAGVVGSTIVDHLVRELRSHLGRERTRFPQHCRGNGPRIRLEPDDQQAFPAKVGHAGLELVYIRLIGK